MAKSCSLLFALFTSQRYLYRTVFGYLLEVRNSFSRFQHHFLEQLTTFKVLHPIFSSRTFLESAYISKSCFRVEGMDHLKMDQIHRVELSVEKLFVPNLRKQRDDDDDVAIVSASASTKSVRPYVRRSARSRRVYKRKIETQEHCSHPCCPLKEFNHLAVQSENSTNLDISSVIRTIFLLLPSPSCGIQFEASS